MKSSVSAERKEVFSGAAGVSRGLVEKGGDLTQSEVAGRSEY